MPRFRSLGLGWRCPGGVCWALGWGCLVCRVLTVCPSFECFDRMFGSVGVFGVEVVNVG